MAYSNDFEKGVGAEWSRNKTDVTPKGNRKFLGQFGNDKVSLALTGLPEHRYVRVTVKLLVLLTWGGNQPVNGPDFWTLDVEKGPTLIHTTFSNCLPPGKVADAPPECWQSFPDPYPFGRHPATTGADEVNTLGYTYDGRKTDSAYSLKVLAPHSGGKLTLNFTGTNLEALDNESWGIQSITVEVSSDDLSGGYGDRMLTEVWTHLGGDPMTGFAGIWEMVAAGDKAPAFVRARIASPVGLDGARLRQLLGDLDSERYTVRENASKELRRLGPQVAPVLRETLASTKSEEVKARIQTILDSMEQEAEDDAGGLRWVRAVSALEVIGSQKAMEVLEELRAKGPCEKARKAAGEALTHLVSGNKKSP